MKRNEGRGGKRGRWTPKLKILATPLNIYRITVRKKTSALV